MNVLDIFYVRYYKEDGIELSIGGIESYITQLTKLASRLGIQSRIFQFGNESFERSLTHANVFAIKRHKKSDFEDLYKYAESKRIAGSKYVNVIANEPMLPNWKVPNSIAIQHGIGFDSEINTNKPFFLHFALRTKGAYYRVKHIDNVDELVCVDHNYICWYRTQTPFRKTKMTPILNFTELAPERITKTNDVVKIVFARRFVPIRGTRLFGPVAKQLLEKYQNIEITFAGDGPDKKYLKNLVGDDERVIFTSYSSTDSLKFHEKFNIAVVPTLYSEGTSLSLLEAMSAHCAVVCTNIGGMTNIILDEYNGLMVLPDQDELLNALCRVIESENLRNELSQRGYETIKKSFSLAKWEAKWEEVLKNKFTNYK